MKKKILFLIICIFAVLVLFGINTVFATVYYKGDVNGDGSINKTDAVAIAKYIINKTSTGSFSVTEADVNGDGSVKVNDVVLIITGSAQMPSQNVPVKINADKAFGMFVNGQQQLSNSASSTGQVSWSSNKTSVATVSQTGLVQAVAPGVATITASSGANSDSVQVIVVKYNPYDSYESSTLKYWIERPETGNYVVARIWVDDVYNQARVAMTNEVFDDIAPVKTWSSSYESQMARAAQINECIHDSSRTYKMYNVMDGNVLFANEISKMGYHNKGIYAVNASPMVSTYWSTSAPCDWFGTSTIPVIINNGVTIRNSTNSKPFSGRDTLGITRNGVIKNYPFEAGSNATEIATNQSLYNQMISDGVKYTFANFGGLVSNYQVVATKTDNNIRSAICQIDVHNYILISSTIEDTSDYNRDNFGISTKFMAEEMVTYGCQNGYNFDGGGSEIEFYMKNDNEPRYAPPRSYDGRGLSDLFYFVEK